MFINIKFISNIKKNSKIPNAILNSQSLIYLKGKKKREKKKEKKHKDFNGN